MASSFGQCLCGRSSPSSRVILDERTEKPLKQIPGPEVWTGGSGSGSVSGVSASASASASATSEASAAAASSSSGGTTEYLASGTEHKVKKCGTGKRRMAKH